MKCRTLAVFLCMALVAACSSEKVTSGQQILNSQLSEAFKITNKSFKKVRTPLAFDDDEVVNNCNDYFKKMTQANVEETTRNYIIKSEYLVCDSLKIISESSELTSKIEVSKIGQQLLSKLDLRSFPSSMNRAGNEKSHTLVSLFPENVSANKNVATLDTEDWMMTFEVVAIADHNKNNTADWIVNFSDEAKDGTYRSYQTIIIYDAENSTRFNAYPYPKHKR